MWSCNLHPINPALFVINKALVVPDCITAASFWFLHLLNAFWIEFQIDLYFLHTSICFLSNETWFGSSNPGASFIASGSVLVFSFLTPGYVIPMTHIAPMQCSVLHSYDVFANRALFSFSTAQPGFRKSSECLLLWLGHLAALCCHWSLG